MIWPFNKSSLPSEQVFAVYNAIVSQSRQETFYADWAVPDTVTGRFDMICLHMCLVFRRLRPKQGGRKNFTQDLFDIFFKDMDQSLRELGITDVGVPKRIEKMGSAFYGLLEKVTTALDANDEKELVAVLNRNIFDNQNAVGAEKLGHYLQNLAGKLDTQDADVIQSGTLVLGEAA